MKTKFSGILTLLLAFVVHLSFAQEKTISGTVSDVSGLPLPGVNIIVKGTTNGTQTDFDGNYSITASVGDVLSFTYLGLKPQEVSVGASNTINITMAEDTAVLDEVIVTAQGIKREKKALGYAVSEVKAEQIESRAESDLGRILSGKAAGVNITSTSGMSGSGTNIIIRGYTSISGSNQPLFIVNGVPFDGGTNSQTSFADGATESSRFLDLDPNNIESIDVLKGLNATVLYGEQGRNGVILITTKNAATGDVNKKLEITLNQSYFNTQAILPDYTEEYGGGFHQDFGFFFSSWGPNFADPIRPNNPQFIRFENGVNVVRHPFRNLGDLALRNAFPEIRDSEYLYKFYPSVENFFRTGSISNTSINLRGGSEKVNFNMNYSHLHEDGFVPGNRIVRNNIGVGGNAQLTNKITASGNINIAITDYNTPPLAASLGSGVVGGGASVFGDVMYTPPSVDLLGMPYQTPDGRSIYYRAGNDIQNPLWTVHNTKLTQDTNRFFGNFNLTYDLTDWIDLTYRAGIDFFSEFNSSGQNKGGVDGPVGGFYRTIAVNNTIWDHTVLATGDKNITDDLNIKAVIGATSRRNVYKQDGVESVNQIAFGTLEHFNFIDHSTVGAATGNIAFQSEVNTLGAYADLSLGFKNYLFLNASGRNDWTSTLEKDNFSLFYKGGSLSFIPTSAFRSISTPNGLNYLKLRAGYGESAGFPPAYSTRNTLGLNSRAFLDSNGNVIPTNSVSNRLGNPNLKPETIQEFEAGFDSRFFDNRFTLNVSYFNKKTDDLITDQNLDPSTGFTVTRINAGQLEVEGVEVDWEIIPVRNDNLNWRLYGNFYADESTVNSLPEGVTEIGIAGFIGTAANYAIAGEPFGVIKGPGILRNEDGIPIIDGFGNYLNTQEDIIIGDPNPDWTSSWGTSLSYKGFSFNMLWQYRHGGDIWSQSIGATIGRGVVDVPFDREALYILPGVKQDGTPNDVEITSANLGFDNFGFSNPRGETLIFDGSTIRLQELSIGYTVPSKFLDGTPFGSLSFTASGFNLWYDAVNTPDSVNFDTNTLSTGVGNGQGLDFISGPSTRRYGFSVKATF